MAKQTGAIALIAQLERLFVQDPNAVEFVQQALETKCKRNHRAR
jgi:hypothetical protein